MKTFHFVSFLSLMGLLCGPGLFAAETNHTAIATNDTAISDLTNLVAKINVKLVAGKSSEADYADNIKEFNVLLVKHKNAKPDDVGQIILAELQLYLEVFDDPEGGLGLLERVKREFPAIQINGNTDDVIKSLEPLAAQRKVWRSLVPGAKCPDFTTTDVSGKPLSLTQYKGKVLLIDFWGTFCPPCLAELPNVLGVYKKYHAAGFDIVGVSLDDNIPKLQAFTKNMNMPWPQSCDGQGFSGKLISQYGVYQLPATFLVNGQGLIIGKDLRGDELEQAVARALAAK